MVCFRVCEGPLDYWANGFPVDVFFKYCEYGFSPVGI